MLDKLWSGANANRRLDYRWRIETSQPRFDIGLTCSFLGAALGEAHGLVDGQPTSRHFRLRVYNDVVVPESVYTPEQIQKLKQEGVIDGGMIPKVDSALEALSSGVAKVHFLDGKQPHSLLLELFTDAGIGTEIAAK